MKRIWTTLFAVVAVPAMAWAQGGPVINGVIAKPRVFNDFSTSTDSVVGLGINPGTGTITDTLLTDDGTGGNFANRHDILLSADGGATAATFDINDSFTFQVTLNLSVGSNSPRKEAGIRINDPVTGDVLLLVNSDAGEIVGLGGGAPFHLFASSGMGNPYVPGTPITLGFTVLADGPGGFNSIEYFIDRGMGRESSTPQVYSNLEHGSLSFNVGMYAQISPENANDSITALFTDVQYSPIPEPSTVALGFTALLGLLATRRR